MRVLCLLGWLMIPLLVGAYHFGPGQEQMKLDSASARVQDAERLAAKDKLSPEDWSQLVEHYDTAMALLPEGKTQQIQRLMLERAKAKMNCSRLPEAHDELVALVETLEATTKDAKGKDESNKTLLAESRAALGNSQYYITWLMRLEGKPRELWELEIEASRQTFKYLAEEAARRGDTQAVTKNQEDLESAIRLARMDLRDLQGLPLPSQ